jgi:hypothetical protein
MQAAWREAAQPLQQSSSGPVIEQMDDAWKEGQAAPGEGLGDLEDAWAKVMKGEDVDIENIWAKAMEQANLVGDGPSQLESAWQESSTAQVI